MSISEVKGYQDIMADIKVKDRADVVKKIEGFNMDAAEKKKWKRSIPKSATVILMRRVYEKDSPEYQLLCAEDAKWFQAWTCFEFQVVA